jgi:hypothetical protein
MLKPLGKLTEDQLRRLLKLADETPSVEGLSKRLRNRSSLQEAIRDSGMVFHWSWVYELSMLELLALMVWVIDRQDELVAAAKSDDPQEAILLLAEDEEEPSIEPDSIPAWRKVLGVELFVACALCFQSYRSYSVSLCELVEKVRNGNLEALCKAIRIDPSTLSAPSVSQFVSEAVFHGRTRVLKQIKGAYATPRKKLAMYTDLRFVEVLLHEAEAFEHAPSERIYDVVVNRLGLYDHRSEDPRKGLEALFKRWRESSTT